MNTSLRAARHSPRRSPGRSSSPRAATTTTTTRHDRREPRDGATDGAGPAAADDDRHRDHDDGGDQRRSAPAGDGRARRGRGLRDRFVDRRADLDPRSASWPASCPAASSRSPSRVPARATASPRSARARPTSPTRPARSTTRRSPLCEDNGIEFVELEVAIDGLTVATSPANEAITCLDIPALYALVGPESEGFANWSDASELAAEVGSAYADAFPDAAARHHRPRRGGGTYDTFVEFAIADLAEERGARTSDPRRLRVEPQRQPHRRGHRGLGVVAGLDRLRVLRRRAGADEGDRDRRRRRLRRADRRRRSPTAATRSPGACTSTSTRRNAAENPAVASFVDLYLSPRASPRSPTPATSTCPTDRIAATQDAWAGR